MRISNGNSKSWDDGKRDLVRHGVWSANAKNTNGRYFREWHTCKYSQHPIGHRCEMQKTTLRAPCRRAKTDEISGIGQLTSGFLGLFLTLAVFGSCAWVFLKTMSSISGFNSQALIDCVLQSFGV